MTRPSDAAITLKPCPWCGSTEITVREGSTFRWRIAECGCGATCGEVRHNTMADDQEAAEAHSRAAAIAEWNARVIDAEAKDVSAEVGAVVAALKRRFSEIEDEIAANRTTAPQVFTWMRTAALDAIASAPTAVEGSNG